jgi:hypothetical protein
MARLPLVLLPGLWLVVFVRVVHAHLRTRDDRHFLEALETLRSWQAPQHH